MTGLSDYLDRIKHKLLWIEIIWSINVGSFRDESYCFFWFVLTPVARHRNYHDVIREFDTFLTRKIGGWYFLIRDPEYS